MHFQDKYAQRDKHLLRMERELSRLRKAQWHAPIIPLEHPYQRGWFKTFTLREDALHHPEGLVFKAVLAVVNQRVQSRTREFMRRNGDPIALRPRIIEPRDWRRLVWPISHQRLFAYGQWPVEDIYPWTEHYNRHSIRGFKLIRTWWLDELILPFMITHQRVDLPEVRSRITEIENHLRHRLGWERLQWLHGHHVSWRYGPETAVVQRANVSSSDQFE
jgi:hypothetical protein